MIAQNSNSLCRQTKLYYYDFLYNESRRLIPEPFINHIEQCQHCREQINQLKAALSQAEGFETQQRQVSSAVTAMLKLHFAYIGKPVTCNIIKPFLPTPLDQASAMSIPTPIVTHLCNCPKCSEDLDMIRCLNLNRKQLCRLSQLFAEKSAESNIACSKAQNAIPSVASMVFSETNSEVLKHLCKCPVCRGLLYKERQKICDSLPEYTKSPEFPCESVSTTDIFDYVVPYGLDPASDQYAKFRKSFTSHVVTCPNCLAKMQTLHDTVYYIVERPESEVATIYNIEESTGVGVTSESNDIYAGFPISVEVVNREDEVNAGQPASTIGFRGVLKQKVSAMNLKPLVKAAIVTAAVISIAAALFFNMPAAKAVTIERIYEAIEKVKNVYISKFVPDQTEPIEEKWVSRELDTYITKTGNQVVLWDIPNRVRKTRYLDTGSVETVPLFTGMIIKIEETITGFLGLVPFTDLSVVPDDIEWNHIADDNLRVIEGTEVYDLIWVEEAYDGSLVFNKWRAFVDVETNLPLRTEFYRKSATDSEYTLETVIAVKYLNDSEIQTIVEEVPF